MTSRAKRSRAACTYAIAVALGLMSSALACDDRTGEIESTPDASPRDASPEAADGQQPQHDAGCPYDTSVPDAVVYTCDAEPPDADGCVGAPLGYPSSEPVSYPINCSAELPELSGSCSSSTCCPARQCVCSSGSFCVSADAGACWDCPI